MNLPDLIATLAARGQSVATCESLTAGLVAAIVADVPGASSVLRGGLITYATDLKVALAGLDPAVVAEGVVTEPVAQAMARGTRLRCGATWGLATTGVAGPGPYDGVPAGRVWIAVDGPTSATQMLDMGDVGRERVRRDTVTAVLALLGRQMSVGR